MSKDGEDISYVLDGIIIEALSVDGFEKFTIACEKDMDLNPTDFIIFLVTVKDDLLVYRTTTDKKHYPIHNAEESQVYSFSGGYRPLNVFLLKKLEEYSHKYKKNVFQLMRDDTYIVFGIDKCNYFYGRRDVC